MQAEDLRLFIPSLNFQESSRFYEALGFNKTEVNDELAIFVNGGVTFFLQNHFNQEFAQNLMMQLIVKDIQAALNTIQQIKDITFKFEPIKQEHWGKVIYLWGPAGELWHITELNS
ncbi:hypothetical protein [Marinicellulosiphila megalodicopiae]|uniref:hypothetical protein n=1 Tax=Marinicellulosiphila megalodicopiae TaxID=2724896 RepID=UPI003BB206A8